MDLIFVAAALTSAFLHAAWNAAVKASADPRGAMSAQMMAASLIALPGLAWTGLPASAAWIWIAGSTLTNTIAILALLRAYETGGFAMVYPVWRATAVLAVVPLSALLLGDRVGLGGLAGILLIATALGLLAANAGVARDGAMRALGWTLVASAATALCILCDAQGARQSGSPFAYGIVVSTTNALAMAWRQRNIGSPMDILTRHWALAFPAAVASMISYLLILWVWSQAPIAPSAALRDTSAIFAILIAVTVMRERLSRLQLFAVLAAAAAVPLLRLG